MIISDQPNQPSFEALPLYSDTPGLLEPRIETTLRDRLNPYLFGGVKPLDCSASWLLRNR
jgi:hypothetical protein